jgi:hypothetical protein
MGKPGASVFREITLKLAAADPFETLELVSIYQTTSCHAPDVRELDIHRNKGFKFPFLPQTSKLHVCR